MFDTADMSGHRITYLGWIEVMVNAGATLAGMTAFALVLTLGDLDGMRGVFFAAAVVTLGIASAKFQLYQK
jgi:hypothetical protein